MNGQAANRISQGFAHPSTPRNASGLIVRVRDGYGSCPTAVAAFTPTRGIEPRSDQTTVGYYTVCPCDPVNAWTRSRESQYGMTVGFGRLVLAGSTSRCLDAHTPSLSISSSTSDLGGISFPGGFRA